MRGHVRGRIERPNWEAELRGCGRPWEAVQGHVGGRARQCEAIRGRSGRPKWKAKVGGRSERPK